VGCPKPEAPDPLSENMRAVTGLEETMSLEEEALFTVVDNELFAPEMFGEEKPPKRARHVHQGWESPDENRQMSDGSQAGQSEFDGEGSPDCPMLPRTRGFAYRPTSDVVTADIDKVGRRITYDVPGTGQQAFEPKSPPLSQEHAPRSLQEIVTRAVEGRARFSRKPVVPQSDLLHPGISEAMASGSPEALKAAMQDKKVASQALHHLCQQPNISSDPCFGTVMSACLEAGADVEYLPRPGTHTKKGFERRHGKTPLMWAALRGDLPVVELLLHAKADVLRKDFLGFHASNWGNVGRTVRETRLRVTHTLDEDVQEFQHWYSDLKGYFERAESQACGQILARLENDVKEMSGPDCVSHLCSMLGVAPEACATEVAALQTSGAVALKPAVAGVCKLVSGATTDGEIALALQEAELPDWEKRRLRAWHKVLMRWGAMR